MSPVVGTDQTLHATQDMCQECRQEPVHPSVFLLSSAVFGPDHRARGPEMKSWNQDCFYNLYFVVQIKKYAWSSRSVLHQRCISDLERDLAICLSTSLSHDCVIFPINVRTRRTYLGLYQLIRIAHPFPQNLSLEYCIRTGLCHWSLLD